MKISREWLQNFFDAPLPDARALADALTFHAFEIESVENDILDVKVTPNRGHDCLSHRGIAKEISAILNIPMKSDSLRENVSLEPETDLVSVSIETPLCSRYIAGYIKGVKVGPTPAWLREHLETIGQRSINNIVDAANYVMFNIGQPLHAFDAGQLKAESGRYAISVRSAREKEKMMALDDKEYTLGPNNLVIADGNTDSAIGIAGVKGGKPAGVTEATRDIIIESANFDGVSVRRTAQALKLRTDASERFQQVISPELAAHGMREVTDLILKIAGGELVGFADAYPKKQEGRNVDISVMKVNNVLGTTLTEVDVSDAFARLGLPFTKNEGTFTVSVPLERLDIAIPEDLIEEVARIAGYERIPAAELPMFPHKPEVNKNFYAAEHMRENLMSKGYSEVFTSVFADRGEREVLNKVGGERPFLRDSLVPGLEEALEKNKHNKDLFGLEEIKLFEIGIVWKDGRERTMLGTADGDGVREVSLKTVGDVVSYENQPFSNTVRYQPFSKYPFIVRDIALWVPTGTKPEQVLDVVRTHTGELLVRSALFDTFEKEGRISYAFHLVFQSFDKTLTDGDANERMESVYKGVQEKGWEVR